MNEQRFVDEGMRHLSESLRATGVLSEDYRKNIEGWALQAVSEGYKRGVAHGRSQAIDVLGGDLLRRIADLRTRADDRGRDTYTVVLGQMLQLGLITEEQYNEAMIRERDLKSG